MKISGILNKDVKTISENETIHQALQLMTAMKHNGLPVVNQNNELVGMVVKADIYRFLIDPGRFEGYPVERVMSKSVITAEAGEDIVSIAKRIRDNNIVAMPVVDNKTVIGMVSLEDIVDYFIRQ